MNIREALEKIIYVTSNTPMLDDLAPKVEAALRAAYNTGYDKAEQQLIRASDSGVTAGVEELAHD